MQTAQRQQGAAALQPQPPEPPAAHHLFLMTHTATGLAAGLVLPQPKMAWQGWGQSPRSRPKSQASSCWTRWQDGWRSLEASDRWAKAGGCFQALGPCRVNQSGGGSQSPGPETPVCAPPGPAAAVPPLPEGGQEARAHARLGARDPGAGASAAGQNRAGAAPPEHHCAPVHLGEPASCLLGYPPHAVPRPRSPRPPGGPTPAPMGLSGTSFPPLGTPAVGSGWGLCLFL